MSIDGRQDGQGIEWVKSHHGGEILAVENAHNGITA
jgi:hypothetical protein